LCRSDNQRSDLLCILNAVKPNTREEGKVWETDTRDPGLGDQRGIRWAVRMWGGGLVCEEAEQEAGILQLPALYPSTMNDQGLKPNIPLHPRRLERTAFEHLVLSPCQLKPRSLFNKMLTIFSFSINVMFFCYGYLGQRGKSKMGGRGEHGQTQNLVKLCLGNTDAIYHSSVEDCTVVACTRGVEATWTWVKERLRLGGPGAPESRWPASH